LLRKLNSRVFCELCSQKTPRGTLPVNSNLVFYKTDDETEIVYVVRIMYGGRDVHKQLSQTEDVSVN